MDLNADSGTLPTHSTVEGPAGEQELSLSSTTCEPECGGTILLQLLEFKTHLLEAVEELHIRRDAETRFEDQLSQLVLEKQELEWEKESLQQQIETLANQHTESLTNIKKQFQAKIRNTEEEKWKHQVSAELKDKEINNLKEELKSLQLLKYNLEKKSSELEQKLALQSRSKDSHLNQLGEVEKRFSALSRQCAMVKQAHEKLEQNVDEAMSINKKLSSANEKQEATIVLLKKELEDVSKKLIKAKMISVTHDKAHSLTGREQHIQQLNQKLNMETEMNKKLWEENEAVRAEKQEVMRSLQHAEHLLLSQTQTVRRAELELQTQREQYQALKHEHEMMQEKSKAVEDKVAQLMESYAASRTSWDKEKTMFLDRIKHEQRDRKALKEAYDALDQKHTELSSLAKVQEQRMYELELRDSSQVLCVATQVFPTSVEEAQAEKPFNEQHSSSTPSKNPYFLEDTGTVTKPVATGGQEAQNHDHQSQNNANILKKFICNSDKNGSDPDVVSDLIYTSSCVFDDNLQIGKGNSVSGTTTYGFAVLVNKDKNEGGNIGIIERKSGGEDDCKQEKNNRKEENRNTVEQWNTEEVLKGDETEGESIGEKKGTLMIQTADTADRQENNKGSAEDAGDTRNPETETGDRAEGEGTDGVEEREKTAVHTSQTPETQIPSQTTTDTTIEKSNTQQVIDFMDIEPPLAISGPLDCSQNISLKVLVKDADFIHANKGWEIQKEQLLATLNSDESQSVNCGPDPVMQEVQIICYDEVQTQDAHPLNQLPNHIPHISGKNTGEEKQCDKSVVVFHSKAWNQSSICCTHANDAPLVTETDGTVSICELETSIAQTVPNLASDMKSNMKQTDEMCDTKECLLVRTPVKSQSTSMRQKISERENGQMESLVTEDDDDGDSSGYRKSKDLSNVDMQENTSCKTITNNTVELEAEVESGSCQDHIKNDKIEQTRDAKITKNEIDLKLYKNNESAETGSLKCNEHPPAKEMLLDNTDELFVHSSKTYRSSFDWGSAQRKAAVSGTKSDVSILRCFAEGTEQNTFWSGGNLRHPSSTTPMFLKSKHNKVPLVITRASELLNASSVSGTAASSRRHQQGERKAIGESCRETTAADTESRASLLTTSIPVSTPSSTISTLSRQATPGCSRASTSAASLISDFDWEPSLSQDIEDQQSSFRAQISKIEQFLNTERLCLHKRRTTDN